jgi:hypothetical protein
MAWQDRGEIIADGQLEILSGKPVNFAPRFSAERVKPLVEDAVRMAKQAWRFGQRGRLDSRRFGFKSESSSRSACSQSEV